MRLGSTLALCSFVALARAWTTYTVAHSDGKDDAAPLMAAMASGSLSTNATILFSKGTTYNIWTPLTFTKLTNVEVSIQGNLTLPTDIPTIQNIVKGGSKTAFNGAWFVFNGGNNISIHGSTNANWGWIDSHGQAWWDAVQQTDRPSGWSFKSITNSQFYNLKIWKPIEINFQIGGNNIHGYNNQIFANSDSSSFPFNTDGFDASGTNILLENNHVENGDDCFTVSNGAVNVSFINGYCKGGHGISIGSLGSGGSVANVQNVYASNVQIVDSLYGARFKSYSGGRGSAKNCTWEKVTFTNVRMPIYVTQNYYNQELGPPPPPNSVNNTDLVDFTFKNFEGTINDDPNYFEGSCVTDPCWYFVPGATGKEVIILDLYPGFSSNIVAKKISATTESGAPPAVLCSPDAVSGDLGFQCQDGKFIPDIKGS